MAVAEKRNNLRRSRDRFLSALLEGDDEGAHAAVKSMLSRGAAISEIYVNLLTPAMTRIGDLWRGNKINVAQQKLASEITLRQMERLRVMVGSKQRALYRALVCCIEGEQHSTGAEMMADLLRLEGWSVDFLGADVPTRDILTIVRIRQPQLLALSITMKRNLRHLRRLLEVLSSQAVRPKIVIGGQATPPLTQWKVRDIEFEASSSLMGGLQFALSAFRSTQPKTNLEQYLKEIGLRIRELRIGTGQTQAQLAQSAGLNRAYIVSVEQGKQNISMGVIIKIANALGVMAKQLLVP